MNNGYSAVKEDRSHFEIVENEFINASISVFILLLIISGNFLGELMPCRVREELSSNMVLKHFFGYLTLTFFAIVTVFKTTSINILLLSFLVYVYFIFLSKTNWRFWIVVVFLLGTSYIIHVMGLTINKDDIKEDNKTLSTVMDNILPTVQLSFVMLALFLTFIGSIIYMGNKKKEYGKDFSYIHFFLGKPECRGKSPNTKIVDDLKYAFK